MRISVTLLQYEHGIVRQAIDVLADVAKGGRALERKSDVVELMGFLDDYIDRFHHEKEENCFYPHVLRLFPGFKTDIDEIHKEHDQAKRMLGMTMQALSDDDWVSFQDLAMQLVRHMMSHVEKEEDDIFPAVDEEIPIEVDEEINECYQSFDRGFGEDYYQRTETFANDIQARMLGTGFYEKGIY